MMRRPVYADEWFIMSFGGKEQAIKELAKRFFDLVNRDSFVAQGGYIGSTDLHFLAMLDEWASEASESQGKADEP